MSGDLTPTKASEKRAKGSFVARVSPNLVVRLRKSDPLEIVFSGMLKLPMLKAAQMFEDVRDKYNIAQTDDDKEKQLQRLIGSDDKEAFHEFLRSYAIRMVIEPVIVAERDGNPEHLHISDVDFSELLGIFVAEDPEEQGAQRRTEAEVTEFRRPEPEPSRDDASSGEEVRSEAQLVALPKRDVIYA